MAKIGGKKKANKFMSLVCLLHSGSISCDCEIGGNIHFGYNGIGIVIHPKAKIGENCIIM